jgi:ACS family glucarate transporter-like MFS transporter
MLASRSLWFLTLAYFTFGYIAFIFVNWFFIYLAQVRGLNLKATALYATLPFIAMIISCVAGGWISDWLVKHKSAYIGRCVFSSAALVLTAIFLALGSTAADTLVATLVLAGGAGSLYLSQNAYWAVSADFGGRHAGIVSGLMNMGCQIAGAITASLTPWIARGFGWNTAFYVASAAALLGAVAWLFVDPRRTLVSPEQMRVAD